MANPFLKTRIFIGETVAELQKAVWPTRAELKDHTIIVIVATALMGFYIFLADFSVYSWIDFLTGLIRG